MKNLINETLEFIYSPQAKAKLKMLIDKNFVKREIDSLVILEDLPNDNDVLEGEDKFNIKK